MVVNRGRRMMQIFTLVMVNEQKQMPQTLKRLNPNTKKKKKIKKRDKNRR
jgi:hypothetical protein